METDLDRPTPLEECPICDLPQPREVGMSLHLDSCPEHDRGTCVTCTDMHLKGIEEDQDVDGH